MIFSDAFMAIADPNRRHLLEELRRGPKTVNELAAGLPVSRPAVSQHLKVLLDAGLVNAKAEGTRRVYTVSNAGFLRLNIWLDQFWDAEELGSPGSSTASSAGASAASDDRLSVVVGEELEVGLRLLDHPGERGRCSRRSW